MASAPAGSEWPEGEVWDAIRAQRAGMSDGEIDLETWWHVVAQGDIEAMLPKVAEYGGTEEGSADLQIMGNALAELCGMHGAPDAVKQEMACWFYALGKISRLVSDYKQGKPGKPDTWHDLTVYSMMARRLQAVGRWP